MQGPTHVTVIAMFAYVTKTVFSIVVGISLALSVAIGAEAQEKETAKLFSNIPDMTLNVVRVIDEDFTDISDSDLAEILDTARKMYRDKFGVDNVTFVDAGKLDIESFFERHLDRESEVFKQKNSRRFRVGEKNDFEMHRKRIEAFVKKWTVEQLQGFFPEDQKANYDSYEKIIAGLILQMQTKIGQIRAMTSKGGSLLRPEKAAYRSYLNWLAALQTQSSYDLVLTNGFILYDDMSHPSPHSIFSTCKVGGVSHRNPLLKTLEGRVIMGSTFGMDTEIPFFMEGGRKTSREKRNRVTGAYIIAHELGHAIFKLPDHYDHQDKCLMNNSKELSYQQGYDKLVEDPGPCPKCRSWMTARSRFWDGEAAFHQKRWQDAIEHYTFTIRNTPRNIDGHYGEYMATIANRMSLSYEALGKIDLAIKGAATAKRLYPWKKKYAERLERLEEAKAVAGSTNKTEPRL